MRTWLAGLLFTSACATTAHEAPRPLALRRVILYQNGLGFFERTGHVTGETMALRLARGELDDVLKTLTVVDRLGAAVATVDVPTPRAGEPTIDLGVRLSAGRAHDVAVSYAAPTPTWAAAYRVVLGDTAPPFDSAAGGGRAPSVDEHARTGSLLQGWAMIHNASQEDWSAVQLTLATGAPMSFALDLHTPQFVSRPDATARLAPAHALAPIDAEQATAPDRDGDGVIDREDHCPDEPARSNGDADGDGCPVRGRVLVGDASLIVLQPILFARESDALTPAAATPVLDALAATLAAHPDLARVELQASASADEADPWGLTLRRAEAVRAALMARGVAGDRLAAVPVGATQPRGERARDRRVDFLIARREAEGALDPATVAARARARTRPDAVAGAVRYALAEPVSIRRGASAMVSILNQPITAEDAFLWRPDAGAPGSDRHPFRAVRLANTSDYTLEPGPVAVFARGTFVGDGLIGQLPVGQTAWVPYALDAGATVIVTAAATEQPVRIATVRRGVLTVELAGVRTTTYAIAAGHDPASAIYLRHPRAPGFAAVALPPGAIDEGDAYLVRLPLAPDRTTTLAIEERQPRTRTVELTGAPAPELAAYVAAGPLEPALEARLRAAIALRAQLGALDDDIAGLRERVADAAARAQDLRASLRALERLPAAALRKKLVASLTSATADAESLARQLGERTEARAGARAQLADAIRDLSD